MGDRGVAGMISANERSTHAPLRVLFLCREYGPVAGAGGIGAYVDTMTRALARRGHAVHVLSCAPGQRTEDLERAGVHVHLRGVRRVLPKIRNRVPSTAFRVEGAVSCYVEFLDFAGDVDVVETPDWMAEGLAFALLGSLPVVVHLHTPLSLVAKHNPGSFRWTRDGKVADLLERLAVRRVEVATSPSRLLASDLARERWGGRLEPRIIRYPIDVGMWDVVPPADSAPARILAVGRLEARKAPEVVVRAASALAADVPGLETVFVGRSTLRNGRSYRDWLADLANELGVCCRFVDEVSRHNLRTWYGESRVVAVASLYDNFPYAGLEAMASARPLVCTATTGTAEIVRDSNAGAVVAPRDPDGLARALRPFLVSPELAGRAGREARALVTRECSLDRIAEKREACYREAIDRWRRRLLTRSLPWRKNRGG